MQTEKSTLIPVEKAIMDWSAEKRANISLASYRLEIDTWRKLTGIDRVSRIIEIGCGSGLFLVAAIATGFAEAGLGIDPEIGAHGTDEGENAHAIALRDSLNLGDQIEFRQVTMESLLTEGNGEHFDLVVFRNSLHHIHERPHDEKDRGPADQQCLKDLATARGLLKEPGFIHIMDASRPPQIYGALYNIYRRAARKGRLDWSGKRTSKEWMAILSSAGFRHIGSESLPANKWIGNPIGRQLGRLVSSSVLITGTR